MSDIDNSFDAIRRRKIYDILENVEENKRVDILISQLIKTENTLREVRDSYFELLIKFRTISCAQVPF